jgi:two-component system, OmpR family, alkaline phosphatase synthesis response regulator PhoP
MDQHSIAKPSNVVLIVEDEQHLANGLRFNLEAEGYQVEIAGDGETALTAIKAQPERFDVIVLDVMLPGIDGFTVVSELRKSGLFLPVLILTARGRPEDVLHGFEAGADDYLPKPFELSILLARLGGLLRRRHWFLHSHSEKHSAEITAMLPLEKSLLRPTKGVREGAAEQFQFEGKTIDFTIPEIRVGARVIPLTLMEADLLHHLVQHLGKTVSRKSILEEVWGLHEDTDTRAIDNFVVRLRKYIEDVPSKPKYLLTVRGIGYRFVTKMKQTSKKGH